MVETPAAQVETVESMKEIVMQILIVKVILYAGQITAMETALMPQMIVVLKGQVNEYYLNIYKKLV